MTCLMSGNIYPEICSSSFAVIGDKKVSFILEFITQHDDPL